MNANKELIHKEEVYQIVGAAIEVLNGLGRGLHEKPYENALVVEFVRTHFRFFPFASISVHSRLTSGL